MRITILSACLVTLLAVGAWPALAAVSNGVSVPKTVRNTFTPRVDTRSKTAFTTLKYTVTDLGYPPPALTNSRPLAFNSTGQIVGIAYRAQSQNSDCVLYTNGKFVDISATSTALMSCFPYGISDLNPMVKKLDVVGSGNIATADNFVAFVATIASTVKAHFQIFSDHVPSALLSVNDHNQAIGYSYYNPTGAPSPSPYQHAFAFQSGAFAPLKAPCARIGGDCASGGFSGINNFGDVVVNVPPYGFGSVNIENKPSVAPCYFTGDNYSAITGPFHDGCRLRLRLFCRCF